MKPEVVRDAVTPAALIVFSAVFLLFLQNESGAEINLGPCVAECMKKGLPKALCVALCVTRTH